MILKDIINRIDTYYRDIPIHTDEIKQGLQLPCFFVHCISANITRQFQDRFWYSCYITVTFMPEETMDGISRDIVGTNMLFMLEKIPINNGFIRATDISIKEVDGCMQAEIRYSVFVREIKNRDAYMEELKQNFKTVNTL